MQLLRIFIIVFPFIIFLSCGENPKTETKPVLEEKTEFNKEQYLQKGKTIATTTFATLSAELGRALQEGGVAQAIESCNLAAMPLVDSLSKAHQADIRRTSLKVRNPKNAPIQSEIMILKAYQKQVVQQAELKPMVVQNEDQTVSFYAPIKIKELCLNCHGKVGEALKTADHALIKKLYPEDQATGYALNDLRGIWSIQFK